MLSLFELDIPKNNEPVQDTDITTTILYYSTTELKEFRKLCKEGIKSMYGNKAVAKGNIADLILNLLKEKYGTT